MPCSLGAKSLKAHALRRDKGLIYIAGLQVGIRLYMNSLIVDWENFMLCIKLLKFDNKVDRLVSKHLRSQRRSVESES
jgi:hypothetical protein